MEIIISNRIRIKEIPDDIKDVVISELQIPNPKYENAIKHGYSTWNINPVINNFNIYPDDSLIVPRGYKRKLLDHISSKGVEPRIIDKRIRFEVEDIDSHAIKYRPYQQKAMIKLIGAGEEGIMVAPAGSGKTIMGLSLIPILGQPTLWITHTNALYQQTLDRVKQCLPTLSDDDIGIIAAGKWKLGNVITIGMVQTMVKNLSKLTSISNNFGMVVVDEAHHSPATTFTKVVANLNPYYLYGLTATPYRRDKLDELMFQILGDVIVNITVKEVRDYGGIVLPTVKYRAIRSGPLKIDGENILITNKIQTILKHYIVNNQRRNAIIVGDILKEALDGNYCIVLSDRRQHCENLFELISMSWEKTGIATGKYSKKYVREQVKRFEDDEISVLVTTYSLLGEGFDVPKLNRAFISMPLRAEGRVEQLIGRVQRSYPGKSDSVVYDYVDLDCGLLENQFFTKSKNNCRYAVYKRLGLYIEPY